MNYLSGLVCLMISIAAASALAQPPVSDNRPLSIQGVTPVSSSVPRYGCAEFRIDLQGTYTNAFDPDDIQVNGQFTAPDGKSITVPAFYFRDYSRRIEGGGEKMTPIGKPEWRLRFAPVQLGHYTVRVIARDKSGKQVRWQPVSFECTKSTSQGFVRRSPDDWRYFQFDSGKAYVPIGANVCWGKDTTDYDRWLPRYGTAGCSYFRVWLGPGWTMLGLEHTGDGFGLGRLDLQHAWRLDYVLDLAQKQGLYVMLCMDSYNELRRKAEGGYGCWEDMPHCAANGGPLGEPREFWTNPTMLRIYRNKLRYLVARYGWNSHVLSWEFWNEVDIVSRDAFKTKEVAKWHADMSDYLRSIDPWKHLQTTSFASSAGKPEIDKLPQIDYTQTHAYGLHDGAPELVSWLAKKLDYKKPSYVGEFGADAGGPDRKVDPNGILLHDGMWSTLMSGSAGTAMLWWWDNHIDPGNLYYHFSGISSFAKGIDFPREGFKQITNASFTYASPKTEIPFRDLMISGPATWEPSEANEPTTLKISADGDVAVAGEVAGILHGNVNHINLHNPLTFETDLPHPTRIRISVKGVSGFGGAHLIGVMDNTAILDKPMPDINPPGKHDTLNHYDGEYTVDVPAGQHVSKVENIGTDWMLVSYVVERAERKTAPDIRLYGMRGKGISLIWVQNSLHNYNRIHATGHDPDPIPPTVLTIPDWPQGDYRVRFWDTYKGSETGTESVAVGAKGLELNLPAIPKDIALRIEKL